MSPDDVAARQTLDRLSALRQHQQDGRRSPHKPLLVLLALGTPLPAERHVGWHRDQVFQGSALVSR